jgi:hypothetical protein
MSSSRPATTSITSIVTNLMRSGAMFTAFDVFRIAQDQNVSTGPYGSVKSAIENEIVQQSTAFDSYTRTLATWIGANGAAPWIYHPAQSNPATYTPTAALAAGAAVAPTTGSVQVTADPTDQSTNDLADVSLPELCSEIGYLVGKLFEKLTTTNNTGF